MSRSLSLDPFALTREAEAAARKRFTLRIFVEPDIMEPEAADYAEVFS